MREYHFSKNKKTLVLGTAMWGWVVDKKMAFELLDRFLLLGGRFIDTASNYPINGKKEDFGLAADWISEWINLNGMNELSVIVKVGSINNTGDSKTDLSASNIFYLRDLFGAKFGSSLFGISIHWDDRGADEGDYCLIRETVDAMSTIWSHGLLVGLSGIKHPEIYYDISYEMRNNWLIQVKENILTSEARLRYQKYFPSAGYLAYGINMGGLKSSKSCEGSSLSLRGINLPSNLGEYLHSFISSNNNLKPSPRDLNDLALLVCYSNSELDGVIVGPRNAEQLDGTMSFWKSLESECCYSEKIDLSLFQHR